jgi:class 3 adenylate cyclase
MRAMSSHRDEELKGSEVRLWKLIEERTRVPAGSAEMARIDQRIWDLFGEQWAIVFTDLSGFSRQVAAFGIIHFLQVIHEQKRILLPVVAEHDGILIKVEADSLMILFRRVDNAIRCSLRMQATCGRYNESRPPEHQVLLCVGVGYGRILRIGDYDVFGQEVNAASKLGEDTAKSGEILLTSAAKEAAGALEGTSYEDIGAVPGSDRNYRLLYRI